MTRLISPHSLIQRGVEAVGLDHRAARVVCAVKLQVAGRCEVQAQLYHRGIAGAEAQQGAFADAGQGQGAALPHLSEDGLQAFVLRLVRRQCHKKGRQIVAIIKSGKQGGGILLQRLGVASVIDVRGVAQGRCRQHQVLVDHPPRFACPASARASSQ